MKIPYTIESFPFTSERGIRVRRDCDLLPENASEDNQNLCDVVKIQYAIELERRAIAAEAKVKAEEDKCADYITQCANLRARVANLEDAGDRLYGCVCWRWIKDRRPSENHEIKAIQLWEKVKEIE